MAKTDTHEITQHKNPIQYVLRCSCGWSFSTSRRQNAWARAAKIRAAVGAHLAGGVNPLNGDTDPDGDAMGRMMGPNK